MALSQYLFNSLLYNYFKEIDIPLQLREELISHFTLKRYSKDEHFSKLGERSTRIAFIISGLFYSYTYSDDGATIVKSFLTKKDFLIGNYNYNESSLVFQKALLPSVVLEAPQNKIEQMYYTYPELMAIAKRGVEKRVCAMYKRLYEHSHLESIDRYLKFKDEFKHLESHIPQHLIASYLGVTPTQLSRLRNKMRNFNICK